MFTYPLIQTGFLSPVRYSKNILPQSTWCRTSDICTMYQLALCIGYNTRSYFLLRLPKTSQTPSSRQINLHVYLFLQFEAFSLVQTEILIFSLCIVLCYLLSLISGSCRMFLIKNVLFA